MPPEGYVVTYPHPGSGIGSNLASLAGAVWFARQLNRSVIVDWRGSAFLKDKALNYFTEFFEPVAEIQGVRVLYAPCPEIERISSLDRDSPLSNAQCREVLAEGASDREFLVLRDYHGPERLMPVSDASAWYWLLKDFYPYVRPCQFVQNEIDHWSDEHLKDHFVVGVNISTGNGEFDKGQTYQGRVDLGIFQHADTFRARIQLARTLASAKLPRYLRSRTRFFFATDSYAMHDILVGLPDAVTRRSVFPPPGVGRVFCDYEQFGHTDRDGVVDTIADMFLLARCNALVRNATSFSTFAEITTSNFNGNVWQIETLFARYWLRAIAARVRGRLRR